MCKESALLRLPSVAAASLPVVLSALLASLAPAQGETLEAEQELDRRLRELGKASPELELSDEPAAPQAAAGGGTPRFELLDLSVNFLGAFGTSTADNVELSELQGGGHDPRKRGFTFQNLELSARGAVDPYFRFETHLLYFVDPYEGESRFEVEEAFVTTSALPHGLELEFGFFLTEFGIVNPQHPHEWRWLDQPVIHSRIFGPDGMRAGGFRLSWQPDTELYQVLHFGMQDANGETMASFLANDEFFEERGVGGRAFAERDVRAFEDFVYLGRWEAALETGAESTLRFGVSGLYGPNATGSDGSTWVLGSDFRWRWRPESAERGHPFVEVQGELLWRSYEADAFEAPGPPPVTVPSDTLEDVGGYLQATWSFARGWAAGLRVEHARGSGANVDAESGDVVARDTDPFRSDRWRVSPLISYQPSEFSRLRLQYNYDDAQHLDAGAGDSRHSLWFGVEILLGRHPAHDL